MVVTPTEKGRRFDALYHGEFVRQTLCEMITNREDDLERERARNKELFSDNGFLRYRNTQPAEQVQQLRECIADLWPRAAFTMNDANRESWMQRFAELGVEVD